MSGMIWNDPNVWARVGVKIACLRVLHLRKFLASFQSAELFGIKLEISVLEAEIISFALNWGFPWLWARRGGEKHGGHIVEVFFAIRAPVAPNILNADAI